MDSGADLQARFYGVLTSTTVRLSAIVWVFGYILVEAAAVAQGRSVVGQMFLANLPLLASGICLSCLLGLLLDRTSSRPAYQRFVLVAGAGLLAGLVQTSADDLWLRTVALVIVPEWREWAVPYQPKRLFIILLLYLWTIYLTIALLWASRTSDQARMNQARAAAFEAAASRAEAAALRLQLNPHFLFNTLNGIASLVVRNRQEQAEEMIGRLADFLRSSFASSPGDLVPLKQEFGTIAAYLHIEEARFGTRLRIDIAFPQELESQLVPNFILQPLVENAVKHGAAGSRGELTISVGARRADAELILSVVNRLDKPTSSAARAGDGALPLVHEGGIGLANTRQRLASHYGEAAWLECRRLADGFRAEIGIPAAAQGTVRP